MPEYTPEQYQQMAQELTQKLNSEQDFRRRLLDDPVKALAEIGLEVDKTRAEVIKKCMAASLLEAYAEDASVVPFIFPV